MSEPLELEDVPGELRPAVAAALDAAGIDAGHLAVELVGSERIAELNARHRGREGPTDVLSFPIDETAPGGGPRELGDVVVCAEHSADVVEAVVHGVLHLAGLDHETDDGEMLALQDAVMERLRDEGDAL